MSPTLEMKVNTIQAGLHTVTFGHNRAPLDVQEATFAVYGLHTVSPAEFGFLRVQKGNDIFNLCSSRTNADVFYDDRYDRVVVVPNEAISGLVDIANLVNAHRRGKEYVIPRSQRDLVYATVDEMLRQGTAVVTIHGEMYVSTSKFGQIELTSRVFSDEGLGIKAQEYGDWQSEQGRKNQPMFFDGRTYAGSQKGPYVNRLHVYGPNDDFAVYGQFTLLGNLNGAFGVSFKKTAEGGAKK